MIKINRTDKPVALETNKVAAALKKLRGKAAKGDPIVSKDIPSHWSLARDALFVMHHGKCCFCERKRDKAREPDVEHYRPKCGVAEDNTHTGYWWLAYEWDNLLWSCKACNEDKKGTHFPIRGRRVRNEGGNLAGEDPLLLNPAVDDCELFFRYDWTKTDEILVPIQSNNLEARVGVTIETLGLNRLELLQERGSRIQFLKSIAYGLIVCRDQAGLAERKEECISNLKKAISPESEFSGLARCYFRSFHLSEYF